MIIIGIVALMMSACSSNPPEKNLSIESTESEESVISEESDEFAYTPSGVENILNHVKDASADDFKYAKSDEGVSILGYKGTGAHVKIPNTIEGLPVVMIDEFAFSKTSIVAIQLPENLKVIKSSAFLGCEQLEAVIANKQLLIIEQHAFSGCASLHAVRLQKGLQVIDKAAFNGTYNLKSIYIPSSVTSLELAFLNSSPQLTIIAASGSPAEEYARASNIKFAALG